MNSISKIKLSNNNKKNKKDIVAFLGYSHAPAYPRLHELTICCTASGTSVNVHGKLDTHAELFTQIELCQLHCPASFFFKNIQMHDNIILHFTFS